MKKFGSNLPCASIKSSLLPWSKAIKPQKWGWVVNQPSLSLPRMKIFLVQFTRCLSQFSILLSCLGQRRSNPKNGGGLLRMWHHMTTRQVCPFQYHSLIYIKICHKNKIFNEYFYKLINFNYFIFKFHIIDD